MTAAEAKILRQTLEQIAAIPRGGLARRLACAALAFVDNVYRRVP